MNLLPFQESPATALAEAIENFYTTGDRTGRIIIQPAGTGKTYEIASALSRLFQGESPNKPSYITSIQKYYNRKVIPTIPRNPLQPASILIITPAAVKTQFSRVLVQWGMTNFLIASPLSMSRSFGDIFLTWQSQMVGGEIKLIPIWDADFMPDILIVDEGQSVKNHNSQIAQITVAAIDQGIYTILCSATPFTRISETYVTCRALAITGPRESHMDSMRGFIFNSEDYYDYNAAAMARFNEYITERNLKIEAHNIKFPHRVFNKCKLIDFKRPEHKKAYLNAYNTWIEECHRQNRQTPEGIAAIWAAQLKFRQAAELIRSEQLAELAIEQLKNNKQVIIASNFVATLEVVNKILIEHHGLSKHKISIIIGGQNAETRQENIDRFQKGDSSICLLTLKSGGAGLSLHHEAQYKNAKPRYCLLPPTWSAIELVQLLGRAHRITSCSTTRQDIIWFRGTIEEDVAIRVERKMRSLKEIVSKREVWHDLFLNGQLVVQEPEDEYEEEFDALPIEALSGDSEDDEGRTEDL